MKNKECLIFALIFCFFVWSFRLFSIFKIINFGRLEDFWGYYQTVRLILNHQANIEVLLNTSFGLPFTYFPFLIFGLFPFKFAEYLLTLANFISFGLVFYLLWKIEKLVFNWWFFILMGSFSFSFPLIFSLGMGNPIGIVTLGIYSLWIFKKEWLKWLFFGVAVLLKIFPAVVIIPYLLKVCHCERLIRSVAISSNLNKITSRNDSRMLLVIFIFLFLLSHLIFYPLNILEVYKSSLIKIFTQGSQVVTIYNQSLSAVIGRWGMGSNLYFVICLMSFVGMIYFTIRIFLWSLRGVKRRSPAEQDLALRDNLLDLSMFYLSFMLFIQPISWQYYFAILLPFLMVKIGQKKWWYFLPLILISLDGNRFGSWPVFGSYLINSQFWGNLVFFSLIGKNLIKSSTQ